MNIVDMHCDTIGRFYFSGEKGETKEGLLENSFQVDLKKMKKGEYLLQNFAMFVPFGEVEDPFKTAMEMIDLYYCELEKNSSLIAPVFSFRDIMKNREAGKMSALLTIEEGETVLGKLSYLRDFYRLGVRMIALTWNFANQIGCPNMHPECEKTGKGIELRTEKA
ncbi:MAG: membrane dipeptidase [Lachnospiraceae bacterium]